MNKHIGLYNTALPTDDAVAAPPPKPPATATVAGTPTRLVELPPITPSDDDLIQLAFKAAMASPQFRRLTPVILGGMLALVSPYASDRQIQNCLRSFRKCDTRHPCT